jgi:hypothetical protein
MPELNPGALREAVSRITPSRLPAFNQHLVEATTNAQQLQSLTPLRAFVHSWAVFVSIERKPDRAARFHAMERTAAEGGEGAMAALAEVQQIWKTAETEAGL